MKIMIDLNGAEEKHCSLAGSFNACKYLKKSSGYCSLFRIRNRYDNSEHAYERCNKCLNSSCIDE